MSRDEEQRLSDIRDAITAIRRHTPLLANPELVAVVHDALLFQLVVIGEAVKALGDATQGAAPEVNWSAIARLRDLITHRYFGIDIDRIVDIVENDLTQLDAAVEKILERRA